MNPHYIMFLLLTHVLRWTGVSELNLLIILLQTNLLTLLKKFVNLGLNIPRNNRGASDDHLIDLLVNNLELIGTSVILSAASNLRGRHTILASIVKNKLTLRDEVLKVHTGGRVLLTLKRFSGDPASFQLIYLGLCLNP